MVMMTAYRDAREQLSWLHNIDQGELSVWQLDRIWQSRDNEQDYRNRVRGIQWRLRLGLGRR